MGSFRKKPTWWWMLDADNKESREELSKGFLRATLQPADYFKGDFAEETNYHMNPIWALIVFVSLFEMRAILIVRTSVPKKENEAKYTWSTTIFEYNAPMDDLQQDHVRVKQESNLHRIPDSTFREKPTIEILFLTGYKDIGVEDTQHFLFLQRESVSNESPSNTIHRNQTAVQNSGSQIDNFTERAHNFELDFTTPPFHPTQPSDELPSKSVADNRDVLGRKHFPSKRKLSTARGTKALRSKQRKLSDLTRHFDELWRRQVFKTPLRMKYDSVKQSYFTRYYDFTEQKFTQPKLCQNIRKMDKSLVHAADEYPDTWVGCSLGDAGNGEAPEHLATKVPTIYQQHNNSFCLIYSLASALFHCGFLDAAFLLASQAKVFASLHFEDSLSKLKEFMVNLVPEIGQPTLYGVRTKKTKTK